MASSYGGEQSFLKFSLLVLSGSDAGFNLHCVKSSERLECLCDMVLHLSFTFSTKGGNSYSSEQPVSSAFGSTASYQTSLHYKTLSLRTGRNACSCLRMLFLFIAMGDQFLGGFLETFKYKQKNME